MVAAPGVESTELLVARDMEVEHEHGSDLATGDEVPHRDRRRLVPQVKPNAKRAPDASAAASIFLPSPTERALASRQCMFADTQSRNGLFCVQRVGGWDVDHFDGRIVQQFFIVDVDSRFAMAPGKVLAPCRSYESVRQCSGAKDRPARARVDPRPGPPLRSPFRAVDESIDGKDPLLTK